VIVLMLASADAAVIEQPRAIGAVGAVIAFRVVTLWQH
jgi:hypothetical protein